MKIILVPLLTALVACSPASTMSPMHGGEGMHHRFDDPEAWAARFDDPGRDAWQRPDEVIRALAVAEDAKIADIGAATGYFTVRLARAAPKGLVFGVDIEPRMVSYLEDRAKKEGLTNVRGIVASTGDAKLPEAVDLILLVDTYHHIGDRPAYFRRLLDKLTAGGRLAIIDFRRGQPMGPPDADKIPAGQVKNEMSEAGYRFEKEHTFLPNQHFLVFAKP